MLLKYTYCTKSSIKSTVRRKILWSRKNLKNPVMKSPRQLCLPCEHLYISHNVPWSSRSSISHRRCLWSLWFPLKENYFFQNNSDTAYPEYLLYPCFDISCKWSFCMTSYSSGACVLKLLITSIVFVYWRTYVHTTYSSICLEPIRRPCQRCLFVQHRYTWLQLLKPCYKQLCEEFHMIIKILYCLKIYVLLLFLIAHLESVTFKKYI